MTLEFLVKQNKFTTIHKAMNGVEAIDLVKRLNDEKKNYDVIFMDLQMPVMDGFEATEKLIQLMKENKIKKVPIIAVSANIDEENQKKCMDLGMKATLVKPVKPDLLANAIKEYVVKGRC